MKIVRYHNDHKVLWNDLNFKSKNGIFLFHRDYIDYHKHKFIDHSLLIIKKDKVIALFPANEKDQEIHSHGGLTFGSLIMNYELKTSEALEIFDIIKEYYSEIGFKSILYKTIPSIFHKYPSEEDLYALFLNNSQLIRRDISSVINLRDKIRFSETKRQAITKCFKNDIVVTENSNYEEYWNLLTEVLAKFETTPVHSLEEIEKLNKSFPDNIRLFEAKKEGVLLAGIVIYDYGKVIHTQYMANSSEGRKFGALDFINNHLINNVFADRDYYSFGISTESQGRVLNSGLIQQKEMMGGRGITLDFHLITL
jgi:hypothetical protein